MNKWTDEWPTEAGLFWFYGWRFGKLGVGGNLREPELCLVRVRGTAEKGHFMYVTHGHFLSKQERADGLWQKTILPELPEL